MKIQQVDNKTNYCGMKPQKTNFNQISFAGVQESSDKLVKAGAEELKKLSIFQKIGMGIKKKLGLYEIHSKGSYTVHKFLEPYILSANEIRLGSFSRMPKNGTYEAPIIHVYTDRVGGKLKSLENWFYKKTTLAETATIDTKDLMVTKNLNVKEGAIVNAETIKIFPWAKMSGVKVNPKNQ